jgi:hypothetical protein
MLGRWVPRKDNNAGRVVLTRGLRRVLNIHVTQNIPGWHRSAPGGLSPPIDSLIHAWRTEELWPNPKEGNDDGMAL